MVLQVGRQEPVMVLRVDKEKGYIDLSKRRVAAEDIQVLHPFTQAYVPACDSQYSMPASMAFETPHTDATGDTCAIHMPQTNAAIVHFFSGLTLTHLHLQHATWVALWTAAVCQLKKLLQSRLLFLVLIMERLTGCRGEVQQVKDGT